jgi:hypothetical protein
MAWLQYTSLFRRRSFLTWPAANYCGSSFHSLSLSCPGLKDLSRHGGKKDFRFRRRLQYPKAAAIAIDATGYHYLLSQLAKRKCESLSHGQRWRGWWRSVALRLSRFLSTATHL